MNDPARPTLIPFRAVDEDGGAFLKDGQAQLLAEALAMAAANWTQEEIRDELQRQFPGKPSENHYLNPAADAVMRRARQAERRRVGDAADLARVQLKGYDERKARGAQAPVEEPVSQEPTEAELAAVTRGSELLAICARYGLHFRYDEDADSLIPSWPVRRDGPVARLMPRFRKSVISGVRKQRQLR